MATQYPGTIDSFSSPAGTSLLTSPDHALQHTNVNGAVTAIETVLGTTAGTSVFKNFTAGQFPARVNSGGTLVQTVIGGTIANTTLGTPVITVGSDATGDLYYRNSGVFTRLPIGSNGQYLTTNGTSPSWGAVTASNVVYVPSVTGASGTAVADATGLGTLVLTRTSNVFLQSGLQVYANPATDWATYGEFQLRRDSTDLGVKYRHELGAGNARAFVAVNYLDTNLSAGTYVYKLRYNSSSATVVTIEQGNMSIFAVSA